MPVISLANPKGGAGKTTVALLLATQLAEHGAKITIIDADPEKWISQWGALPGKPNDVNIISDITEDTIIEQIDAAAQQAQFVIVDLEGTASLMVASAIGVSDLVLIPTQGSSMDARGGAKTIRLIRNQERMARRPIPHAVVLTRTSAAVTSRSQRNVQKQLAEAGIHVFSTTIVERAAFRDLFDYGGTLNGLDTANVSNLINAIANARSFAGEVLTTLKTTQAANGQEAGAA